MNSHVHAAYFENQRTCSVLQNHFPLYARNMQIEVKRKAERWKLKEGRTVAEDKIRNNTIA